MSCGQLALNRVGIVPDRYMASEIDRHCCSVCADNFPKTQKLGDICAVKGANLPKIDLLVGGSPCQGFSFAGKGLNFEDPRSKLFFEFVRLLEETKPKYFMLENVGMLQEHKDVISSYLGVQPVHLNSRLVSAQDRKRWYWTNIPTTVPEDKGVKFSDICEDGWFAGSMRGRRINEFGHRDDYNTEIPLVQYIESRKDDKTNCLTTVGKDNIASRQRVGRTPLGQVEWRYLTRNEMERLQTVPDNYTKAVSLNQAGKMLGNGWTVDMAAHIFKGIK